jgi:uncharacterized repeat protein (TIGR03803 family)
MRKLHFGSIATVVLALTASALPAHAATFKVLYKFLHPGLGYPYGRLDLMNGNLFGTGSGDIQYGHGQVFELTNSNGTWSETSADIFNGKDGSTPAAGLIHDSYGDLYGTTTAGDTYGYGNVFYTFNSAGTWYLEKIWAFGEISGDGQYPTSDLIMDSAGNLYGTTLNGGAYGGGTVFELTYTNIWTETILHNFGGSDGANPYAGLFMDSSGNLYGTTESGGAHGYGTAFELTQSGGTWKETVLHSFGSSKDGRTPYGGLVRNSKTGAFYGTTAYGGTYTCDTLHGYNCGTVFKLYLSSGVWKEKVLYNFTGGSDGAYPVAKLTWGGTTNTLYGTASTGAGGPGTLFKLTFSSGAWHESTLEELASIGAALPYGAVIRDSSGNLYGTTVEGGDTANCPYGCGTAWEYTP